MQVSEMLANVNSECKPITNLNTKIIRDLNRAQKVIMSKRNWSWAQVNAFQLDTVATQEVYPLSPLVDMAKLIVMRDPTRKFVLELMTEAAFRRAYPDQTTSTSGDPIIYRHVGKSPVQNAPQNSQITFVSDDATDVSQTIFVEGFNSSGIMVKEVVALNGVNPVLSVNTYNERMFSVFKSDSTAGTITATSNAAAITNVVLAPQTRSIDHPLFAFFPIPDGVGPLYYDFTFKPQELKNTTDVSLIPEGYHDVIELYAISKLYGTLNKKALGKEALAEFLLRIEDMKNDDADPHGIWSRDSSTFQAFSKVTRERLILGV